MPQTNIAAPSGPFAQPAPPAAQTPAWLASLGVPTEVEPSFFKADSKKQRLVVLDVRGFGDKGKTVELRMKDNAGNPIVKSAQCFAEVDLLDPDTMRNYRWQVLSRGTAAQVVRAVAKHGPSFRGELEVDIWAEGRGMQRTTHVVAAPVAIEPTDADFEEAISTGATQARDDDAKELMAGVPNGDDE